MGASPHPEEWSTLLVGLDPNPLVGLDQDRRILYANATVRAPLPPRNGDRIESVKLGEVRKRVHSKEPEGRGDTPSCRFRGANIAIRHGLTRMQMFQRSFSTKGPGRGIGTCLVRLFTEACLKGKVSFTSSEAEGTAFSVSIPSAPAPEPSSGA